MTNLEWVRNASENDLAMILMCPYETVENMAPVEVHCVKEKDTSSGYCFNCLKDWLGKNKEENND